MKHYCQFKLVISKNSVLKLSSLNLELVINKYKNELFILAKSM